MSTSTVGAGAAQSQDAVGAITQQKITTRRYVSWKNTEDSNGNITKVIDKSSILSESDKKEPETITVDGKTVTNPYAGLGVSWANAERDGLELFSENDIVTYDVKSFEGAELLNPDSAVRLYIYRKGLAVFQTALAQGISKALTDDVEPTPEFNGVTIDLRVGTDEEGTNSINKTPARRAVSLDDKLYKILVASGKSEAEAKAIIAVINATSSVQSEEQEEVAEVA